MTVVINGDAMERMNMSGRAYDRNLDRPTYMGSSM